ncbi:hypothetical protein BKA62DRAFT_87645 [Auriculariales sp. MPI-PUGE-AT-0066]|nr:hypothetical protein BKA62DRAFT_87645 [Auriculariales sp. MPI-PUGE-AT-0066]
MRPASAIALFSYLSISFAAAVERNVMPIQCQGIIAHGTLAILKGFQGERVPLTLNGTSLVLQGTGGSTKPQAQFNIVPCASGYLKKDAINPGNGAIHVNGHVTTADGKCLARDPTSTAVKAVACSPRDDVTQEAQFWSVAIIQHGHGNEDHDQPIDMTVDKFFHHLYGGIVHESVTQPPTDWVLTFTI